MRFYFNMKTAYFTAGRKDAILDRYLYEMQAPAREAGTDVLVPAEDLVKIYSPDMTMEKRSETVILHMHGVSVELTPDQPAAMLEKNPLRLKNPCRVIDGVFYVPAGVLMHFAFGKTVRSTEDMTPTYISAEERAMFRYFGWPKPEVTVGISEDPDFQLDGEFFRWLDVYKKGKPFGNQYRTYWMEEPKKIVPYIVYVPSTYDPDKPSKLVMFLHGGSIDVGERYAEIFGGIELQKAAQRYNYILVMANACTLLSAWGNPPPFPVTEEEKRYYDWGDESAMRALEEVKRQYNIDEDHIYLMGNSMGGGGTLYLPTAHPGMFRAIAPGGNLSVMAPDDLTELFRIPVLVLCGTEDSFGFTSYLDTVDLINKNGGNARTAVVGGGEHLTAWHEAVDEVFRFFEENA